MLPFYLKRGVLFLALSCCSLGAIANSSMWPKEVNKLMLWRVLSLMIHPPRLEEYTINASTAAASPLTQITQQLKAKGAVVVDSTLQAIVEEQKAAINQKLQQAGKDLEQNIKDELSPLQKVEAPVDLQKADAVKEELAALQAEPTAVVEKKAEALLQDKLPDTSELDLTEKDPKEELKQLYEQEVKQDILSSLPTEKVEKLQQRIASAQQVLSKYKSTYESVSSIKDLPKLTINSLKGRPLKERLLPSLFVQVIKHRELSLDLSPYLGYALNKQMLLGVGGLYRISFQPTSKRIYLNAFAYGPKLYWAYKPYKEFWLRLEGEWLQVNTSHELYGRPHLPITRPQLLVGIGKAFKLHQKLKGELQCLYAPFKQPYDLYPTKVQIRLGFYPVKKW
jgi:hypothetical protein